MAHGVLGVGVEAAAAIAQANGPAVFGRFLIDGPRGARFGGLHLPIVGGIGGGRVGGLVRGAMRGRVSFRPRVNTVCWDARLALAAATPIQPPTHVFQEPATDSGHTAAEEIESGGRSKIKGWIVFMSLAELGGHDGEIGEIGGSRGNNEAEVPIREC